MAAAQTTQPAQTLSPATLLVQSMGMAPTLQANLRNLLADPASVRRTSSKDMAFLQKMVGLSELEFNALIARVMEVGLSGDDLALLSDFHQTPLGKKLQAHSRQATSLVELNATVTGLSDGERQALERFVSSGATARMVRFLDSAQFQSILQVELEALPASARP
ncbi:MAG: hypothetical protein RBS27_03630 [Giesbergeria sp.]|nr:hypothetical protein [Giesbergeria sp.]